MDEKFTILFMDRRIRVPLLYELGGRNSLSRPLAQIVAHCAENFNCHDKGFQTIEIDTTKLCGREVFISNPPDMVVTFEGGISLEIARFIRFEHRRNGIIEVTINPFLRDYYRELQKYAKTHNIVQMMTFSTKYASLLYDFVCSNMYSGTSSFIVSIDHLRKVLDCENKHEQTTQFLSKVLDYAVADISANSNLVLSYTTEKKARTIERIVFVLTLK